MMLQQQDTSVKPPDGGNINGKSAKHKGGLAAAGIVPPNGATTTEQQQAQRCPRCESLNTKFCYFNNYSLSQPRHFCKNCRRYWTKGGALRNVPIGGGCRKNKRLKHRDPSCLAALADMDASGSSNILASISGCGIPGFSPSTSSLIQDLANEGHRQLALSRFGMHVFDKRFVTENEHHHQGGVSTQDLFALGAGAAGPAPALLSPYDQSFPGLNYSKQDSQPLMFHPHHTPHELPPNFFDHINAAAPLTPTLDHLSSFTSATTTPVSHHVSANAMSNNTAAMDSQLSLIHHNIQMNGMPAGHEVHPNEEQQQQSGHASAIGGEFSEESTELSMAKCKGKSLISSLSDWAAGGPHAQHACTTANGETFFNVPPQANDSSLWNVSWPEMHAALAGSAAAAGAMLH